LAQHLYNQSTHPKTKYGELYIAYFENCVIEDELVNAVGIFKSETKEPFLKPVQHNKGFILKSDNGVSVNKLDKGCIIFNTDKKKGFKVVMVDTVNKGDEAQYWKEKFLNITPCADEYHFTKDYLNLTKSFITENLPNTVDFTKVEQAELLKRSIDYFKSTEIFTRKSFENEVLRDDNLITSFRHFNKEHKSNGNFDIQDNFEISNEAVKKQSRVYKSIIKLDKNFHIYVHGNSNLIEKGYDQKTGKNFYKIFFDREH
jgi:hypothetical protein